MIPLERVRAWRAACPDITVRSTFIVGPSGKIEKAWYHVKADGHAQKVLEATGAAGA